MDELVDVRVLTDGGLNGNDSPGKADNIEYINTLQYCMKLKTYANRAH